MMRPPSPTFDVTGEGPPVVLLHGLTFDRRSWDPVVDHLARRCRCICVDLPAHGESGGSPGSVAQVTAALADTVDPVLGDPPIVVGHSMGAVVALSYASRRPVQAVVNVDQPLAIRPFVQLLEESMPVLEASFDDGFARFTASMRFEELPPPAAQLARSRHRPDRNVVLGYWRHLVDQGADRAQAEIEAHVTSLAEAGTPFLLVSGHPVDCEQRRVLEPLGASLEVEEWCGTGHFPHLARPERLAALVADLARR